MTAGRGNAVLSELPTLAEATETLHRAYGRKWKAELKRFSETLAQHNARRPAHITAEAWEHWYWFPFGVPEWNRAVVVLRRDLAGEPIPDGLELPEPFSWRKAFGVFGVTDGSGKEDR